MAQSKMLRLIGTMVVLAAFATLTTGCDTLCTILPTLPGCPTVDPNTTDPNTTDPNTTPTAMTVSAGADQTAAGGDAVVFLATPTDATGAVSFAWLVTASGTAGSVSLADAATQTPTATFSNDAEGTFTFQVTATDTVGSATDSVDVVVTATGTSTTSTTFTLNIDSLTGTTGDDTFLAPLELNNAGNSLATLQTGDQATGGEGTDSLTAMLNGTADATITPLGLSGIEVFTVQDFTSAAVTTTLDLTNATDITSLTVNTTNNVPDTDTTVISNIASNVPVAVQSSASDINFSFASAASGGSADELALSLSATKATTELTVTTANTNGFETVSITSAGSAANLLEDLTFAPASSSQRTVNVSGSTALTILGAADANVTTWNAASATANVTLNLDAAANQTVTGGTGNDLFILDTNYTTSDTINGGDGTDILGIGEDEVAVAVAQSNVSNIEAIMITEAVNTAATMSYFGSIATVYLPAGFNGNKVVVASGTDVVLGAYYEGTQAVVANTDTAANGEIEVLGLGTTDTVTVTIKDHDTGDANILTCTGAETVNLVSNIDGDGTPADGDLNNLGGLTIAATAGSGTVNLTGDEALVVKTKPIGIAVINGSEFDAGWTQDLNTTGSTTDSSTTAFTTFTLGDGNDTMVGSTGADVLAPGSGNNVVQPGTGIDAVTFVDGSNILDLEDLNVAAAVTANRVTATGLDFSTTTYSASNEEDGIRFDNITSEGDLSDGAVAGEWQTVTTPANITAAAGQGVIEMAWEFSSSVDLDNDTDGSTLLSAAGATTGTTAATITSANNDDDLVIIAYQSGNAYIYHGNGAGGNTALVGAEIALVAVLGGDVAVGGINIDNVID